MSTVVTVTMTCKMDYEEFKKDSYEALKLAQKFLADKGYAPKLFVNLLNENVMTVKVNSGDGVDTYLLTWEAV